MSDYGKGDDWRKNFDYKKYRTNFDLISASKFPIKVKKVKKLLNGKTRYIY